MTVIRSKECKCAMCGADCEQFSVRSVLVCGSSSLDMRPSEITPTYGFSLSVCRECGYVSDDLAKEPGIDRSFLGTKEYKKCKVLKTRDMFVRKFYRRYLIDMEKNDLMAAFTSIVHAEWACEDAHHPRSAKICRELAISVADQLEKDTSNDAVQAVHLDFLRRNHHFTQVCDFDLPFESEEGKKICMLQKKLAGRKNSKHIWQDIHELLENES